tara:strand:- start:52 stop:231 length:180 start_codon:yes stop_codon:yes gene_type:complete
MEITSAQYENDVVTGDTNVSVIATIDGIKMSVPTDPANRHYAEILEQVAAGDLTIADAE